MRRISASDRARNAVHLRQKAIIQMSAARYYKQIGDSQGIHRNVCAARENWRLARQVLAVL